MKKRSPGKIFVPAPPDDSTCACNECSFMRLNTLEKLYRCLLDESPEVLVPEELREAAEMPIRRMLLS
jgi:quinolinate synthase